MPYKWRWPWSALIAVTSAALPPQLCAQAPVWPTCAQVRRVIAAQAPLDSLSYIERFIGECPDAGDLIARTWQSVQPTGQRVAILYELTAGHRTRAAYDAVLATALDSSRHEVVRQYAIAALLAWAAPRALPADVPSLATCHLDGVCAYAAHRARAAGPVNPPSATVRREIIPLLVTRFIENVSTSFLLRNTAFGAAQEIAAEDPVAFLPLGDRLTARYVCGATWALSNRSRAQFNSLVYQIEGTADVKRAGLDAVPPTEAAENFRLSMTLFGRLRISVGDSLVMLVEPGVNAPIPCR